MVGHQMESTDGATKWNMTLRDDVWFHNGNEFMANTVKFNVVSRYKSLISIVPELWNGEVIDHIEVSG